MSFEVIGHRHYQRLAARHLGKAFLGAILAFVMLFTVMVLGVNAQIGTPSTPPGFELVINGEGVWLFKRDYPNGTPDYVQLVDLSEKAKVMLLYANIIQPRQGRGAYGGDDPRFSLQPLDMFWDEALMVDERTFCVSNGSFFYMLETPTRLAFPLKVDGKRITDGFDILTYPDQKLMLELWDDHADIRELSYENLNQSSAPDIIAGLKEDANKQAKFAVARTFVGLDDRDHDRRYETLLILNTSTAVQAEAAQTLKEFGADKVMMLDGGGSTQLTCQGKEVISSDRLIPQALAVVEGGASPISGTAGKKPLWLVGKRGQDIHLTVQISNNGTESWIPGENLFQFEDADLRLEGSLPFETTVQPGEGAEFNLQIPGFNNTGLHEMKLFWYISQGDKRFAGNPLDIRISVLSSEESNKEEAPVLNDANPTITLAATEIGQRLEIHQVDLPQQQVGTEVPSEDLEIEPTNLLWVPILILPFAIGILLLFVWKRSL